MENEDQIKAWISSNLEYRKMVERIAKNCIKKCGLDPSLFDDLKQDIHYKILLAAKSSKKFKQCSTEERLFFAIRITKTTCADFCRKYIKRKKQESSLDQCNRDIPMKYQNYEDSDIVDMLLIIRQKVRLLDKQFPRKHFWQIYKGFAEGNLQKQIADELGVEQPTISKRRAELMQLLKEDKEIREMI